MSSGSVDVSFDDTLDVNHSGIPSNFTIKVVDPIRIVVAPITLEPITINDLVVRLREFPSIRTHVPANFTVGLSVLGVDLLCIKLCGEAQVITEPFEPNPCETCRGAKGPVVNASATTVVV
jgi:hypothetical protein